MGSGFGRVERWTAQPERGAVNNYRGHRKEVAQEGVEVRAIGANHGRRRGTRVGGGAVVVALMLALLVAVGVIAVVGGGRMVLSAGAAGGARLLVMPMAEGRADERLGLDEQHGEQHHVP